MEKVGDMWERGMALLTWNLSSSALVVDVVVVLCDVGGGSRGVYQRGRGNSKYKAIICKQMHGMENATLKVF